MNMPVVVSFFSFVILFLFLVVALTAHEFAHAWTANRLGDTTAKYSGRLTLNPLAHIDPFWTFIFPLLLYMSTSGTFMFGAAKPVPISYWNLNNPRRDYILVGLSGPLANFLLAFVLSLILRFAPSFMPVTMILENLIGINVVLGVFNLLPIPPLDGSRVVMGLLPGKLAGAYAKIEPFGFLILVALLWMRAFDMIVWPLVVSILKILGIGV